MNSTETMISHRRQMVETMITEIIVESVKAVESTGHTFTKNELNTFVNKIVNKIQPVAVNL